MNKKVNEVIFLYQTVSSVLLFDFGNISDREVRQYGLELYKEH